MVDSIELAPEDSYKANEHLWWDRARTLTENWEGQVFHFGNGYFGVSSDGGVVHETLTLGEKTFWTGGPGEPETNTFGMVPVNPADLDNLVEYKDTGKLVYVGTTSAEHVPTLGASTPGFQDIAFAEETFANFIDASKILHVDKSSRREMEQLKAKLMPYKVGSWGQFQEWVEDIDDKNCQHRHMSQLMCLLPCRLLNPYESPELAEATKVTLNYRGDADFTALYGLGCNSPKYPSTCLHEWLPYDFFTSQVWCRVARMCNWIRLLDGDRAEKIYNDIFRESTLSNMIQYETKANYDDEPTSTPFFLDGTVLSAGYVTEMVLQSHLGTLDILPALPSAWKFGCLKGVKARGGLIMDVEWKNSRLVKAVITSPITQKYKVRYKGQVQTIKVVKKEPYVFTSKTANNNY